MLEFYKPGDVIVEQSTADVVTRFTKANRSALDFLFGAQNALIEEMVFAGNEMFDRTRTEVHLLSEFVSKLAGSRSVKDLKTMGMECTQHQIDFIRRDSERIFKHGGRMVEAAANLFNSRPRI
jgi:hypothetical protein